MYTEEKHDPSELARRSQFFSAQSLVKLQSEPCEQQHAAPPCAQRCTMRAPVDGAGMPLRPMPDPYYQMDRRVHKINWEDQKYKATLVRTLSAIPNP